MKWLKLRRDKAGFVERFALVTTTEYTGFDILGRVTAAKQTTDGNDYTTGYTYSLSGQLLEQTYPSGRVVKNTYDAGDGSLSQVQSKRSAETYRNFANGFITNPAGAVTAMRLGNGRWENTTFNSRLQPTMIGLGHGVNSQNLLKLEYSYGTTNNNGNVVEQKISVPGVAHPFVQTYSYDELNRITNAEETQNSVQTWEQSFTYDRYGNRNFDEANTTTLPKNCGTAPNFTVCAADKKVVNPSVNTANNRLSTSDDYTFDSVGNLIVDAEGRHFTYDAENRLLEIEDVTSQVVGQYYFDGDGRRVKKVVPGGDEATIFVYDASGNLIQEHSIIVQPTQNAKTQYLTNDHLGTPRINTDSTGQVVSRSDYMPYGEAVAGRSIYQGYAADDISQGFTGYQKDHESGLNFARARMYGTNWGRFTTTDPIIMESGRLADPHRINLYGYVRNNPLSAVDPDGEKIRILGSEEDRIKYEQDLNKRLSGTGLQIKVNKEGYIEVAGEISKKLKGGAKQVFDGIGSEKTATISLVAESGQIDFGTPYNSEGKTNTGQTIDMSDLAKLNEGKIPGLDSSNIVFHETIEAIGIQIKGMDFDTAHSYASNNDAPGLIILRSARAEEGGVVKLLTIDYQVSGSGVRFTAASSFSKFPSVKDYNGSAGASTKDRFKFRATYPLNIVATAPGKASDYAPKK